MLKRLFAIAITAAAFMTLAVASAQSLSLDSTSGLTLHNIVAEATTLDGMTGLMFTADPEVVKATAVKRKMLLAEMQARGERPTGPGSFEGLRTNHLAIVDGVEFSNGTIEVEVAGSPAPGAQGGARGFVGVAFRVKDDNEAYDCFYLRPTNGRADDQERRNHTVQYISHPDWTWFRFRSETPSKYETYADIAPNEWIEVKITVDGEKACLYVNGAEQPTLVINDVKSGADGSGKVALWIEGSTIGRFRNLKITK